jgi:large subunit ribosomal protein L15
MKLHELKPRSGSRKPRRRVGRGISAGQGKTAGRGTKGYGARSGSGGKLYRQGGNLPFFRKLPFKRGFTNIHRVSWQEVNLDRLEAFKSGADVTPEALQEAGIIKNVRKPVAILGRGDLKRALNLKVHRISKSAKEKVEAAGGKVELIQEPKKIKAKQ